MEAYVGREGDVFIAVAVAVLMIAAIRGGSVKFTGEIRARCR
ncbi:hypothetical protein [Sorangium sp. So ce1504]